MHELSIAYQLTEIASAALAAEGLEKVEAVHLKLVVMSGILKEALLFGYDIATEGTVLAGSRLIIHEVPLVLNCDRCGLFESFTIQSFRCPTCDQLTGDIRKGREIEIDLIEYQDEEAELTR